jgi:hypothetical protein
MAGLWSRLTGDKLEFSTPDDLKRHRLARMRHNVWLGVCIVQKLALERRGQLVMYTLTYAGVKDWGPRHISGCMRWLRRQGVRLYVWVAELQKRGAVHYHVLAMLPEGQRWKKPDESAGGWSRGFTWVTPDVRRPLYIMKYLQKGQGSGDAQNFPKGLRLYAIAQEVIRSADFQDAVAWRSGHLPAWASCDGKDDCVVLGSRRVRGGVSYGNAIECSPYAISPVSDMERVEWQMRRAFANGCIVLAS